MYRTEFWTLWEKARVGCFKRTALKHVYYLGWKRSPAQVGCMRQVLGPGALGRPRGIGWRGRWEGRSGWGTHVNPWLILVNVWQKTLQYCKVISLQLKKKKKKNPYAKAGDMRDVGLIPVSGRCTGERNGNPFQYPGLENPMDRGAPWAIIHGVAKNHTWLRYSDTLSNTALYSYRKQSAS